MPLRRLLWIGVPLRSQHPVLRCAVGAALAGLAFAVRYTLYGPSADTQFLLFFPAVIMAASLFGGASGISATAVSACFAYYFFTIPVESLTLERTQDVLNLAIFGATGVFISLTIESLYSAYRSVEGMRAREKEARQQAEAGERASDMLLEELRHRIKNDLHRVMTMIDLQARRASPEAAATLQDARTQLQMIGRLHERFSRQDGQIFVDVREFLQDLVSDLRASMLPSLSVGLFLKAESLAMPASEPPPSALWSTS